MNDHSENLTAVTVEVQKLEPKSGDVLVFRFRQRLTADNAKRFRDAIKAMLPDGVKVLVLGEEAEAPILISHPYE